MRPVGRAVRGVANIAAVLALTTLGLGAGATAPASAVIGGHAVSASMYPWLAAIGSPAFPVRPSGQFCGGALIAPDRVLTAGHCAAFAGPVPGALAVTFGRSDLTHTDGLTVGVKEIHIDPLFRLGVFDSDVSLHHDVAVLVLDTPVRLPTVEIGAPHGDSGTVVGWGATSEADDSNARLRQAQIPLVSNATCAAAYGAQFDPAEAFCAGSPAGDTGEFDSGGPLLVHGKVVGITSWAKGSAEPGYPGVYARIPALNF